MEKIIYLLLCLDIKGKQWQLFYTIKPLYSHMFVWAIFSIAWKNSKMKTISTFQNSSLTVPKSRKTIHTDIIIKTSHEYILKNKQFKLCIKTGTTQA